VIVGANSGLGRELALRVASQGLNIIGTGRDVDRLKAVQAECEQKNVRFVPVVADLFEPKAVKTIIDACGNLDIGVVMINAGIGIAGLVSDRDDQYVINYMQLLTTSYAMLARQFILRNRERPHKSVIYMTASVAANICSALCTLYFSAKAYVSRLAKQLSIETAATNIVISAIHPGFFGDSRFFRELPAEAHRILNVCQLVITGSGRVADGVMRTIGKVDASFVTPDSIGLPAFCWVMGEPPMYFAMRCVAKLVRWYNGRKQKIE
jgi:short-subunit dehydrogenase